MPGYLLDTNVVSEVRRVRPHKGVMNWIAATSQDELFLSAVSLGELQAGVEAARRTDDLKAKEIEVWVDSLGATFEVLPMNGEMFREWAKLMQRRSRVDIEDAMIAATARVRGLTIATRNTADFQSFGVALFNPFGFRG
jgi:hypothetical protein